MNEVLHKSLFPEIERWLLEDDLNRNFHYLRTLPIHPVELTLNFKSPMLVAGTDFFTAVFSYLGVDVSEVTSWEGKKISNQESFTFKTKIPFNVAVTGERLALNLLQHGSSVATWTSKFVSSAGNIKILDTRKTTPGLRSLEKYAVRAGGGFNHRLGQTDLWMIKDNHKSCLGGLKGAYEFFQSQGAFYNNIIAEIHDLKQLNEAIALGIRHVMLDNFSPDQIREAVKLKKPGMIYEVSGGIRLDTMKDFLIEGVDALSVGSLTYSAPRVDISLKYKAL
ncbi:MAG: carboxylating nicotinate-nucleotide diphosphorylase [Bacteriovoracaceae bacterium]